MTIGAQRRSGDAGMLYIAFFLYDGCLLVDEIAPRVAGQYMRGKAPRPGRNVGPVIAMDEQRADGRLPRIPDVVEAGAAAA